MAGTSTKINGDNLLIYVDGIAIGHSSDATMNVNQDLPDSTTKDSNQYAEHIHGVRSWDVSGSGLVVPSSLMNAEQVVDLILNASDVYIRYSTDPTTEGGGSGATDVFVDDAEYRGTASVASCSISAPHNAPVGFDFAFTGNGVLTKVIIT